MYIKLFLNICEFNNKTKFLYEVVLLSYCFPCTVMWIVFTSRYERKMGQICVVHTHTMKSYGGRGDLVEVLLPPVLTLVLSGGEWWAFRPSWFASWDQTVFVSAVHVETTCFYSCMKCFSQLNFNTFGSSICSSELVKDGAALFKVCSLQILLMRSVANLWKGRLMTSSPRDFCCCRAAVRICATCGDVTLSAQSEQTGTCFVLINVFHFGWLSM
jgi:hypothetical protein